MQRARHAEQLHGNTSSSRPKRVQSVDGDGGEGSCRRHQKAQCVGHNMLNTKHLAPLRVRVERACHAGIVNGGAEARVAGHPGSTPYGLANRGDLQLRRAAEGVSRNAAVRSLACVKGSRGGDREVPTSTSMVGASMLEQPLRVMRGRVWGSASICTACTRKGTSVWCALLQKAVQHRGAATLTSAN